MRILGGLVLASTAFSLAGCMGHWDTSLYRYSSKFHQTVPAAAARSVHLTNVSGPVTITPWDKPTVEINAVLRAPSVDAISRLHVDINQQGDAIRIATRYGERGILNNIGQNNQGSIDYILHIPSGLSVRVENVSGDVTVKNIRNDVDVHDISGRVMAEGVTGSLDLGTTSGDIVAIVKEPAKTQHFKLYTVSGDVALTLPKNTPANVKADSISGDFSSNLPIKAEERTVGSQVDQQINGGGAQIEFHTVSGAIKLTGK